MPVILNRPTEPNAILSAMTRDPIQPGGVPFALSSRISVQYGMCTPYPYLESCGSADVCAPHLHDALAIMATNSAAQQVHMVHERWCDRNSSPSAPLPIFRVEGSLDHRLLRRLGSVHCLLNSIYPTLPHLSTTSVRGAHWERD